MGVDASGCGWMWVSVGERGWGAWVGRGWGVGGACVGRWWATGVAWVGVGGRWRAGLGVGERVLSWARVGGHGWG